MRLTIMHSGWGEDKEFETFGIKVMKSLQRCPVDAPNSSNEDHPTTKRPSELKMSGHRSKGGTQKAPAILQKPCYKEGE